MNKTLIPLESILLFVALSFTIPIPNSAHGEYYDIFPSIMFASVPFFLSRGIRHQVYEHRTYRIDYLRAAYVALEVTIFATFFVVLRRAALMIV